MLFTKNYILTYSSDACHYAKKLPEITVRELFKLIMENDLSAFNCAADN